METKNAQSNAALQSLLPVVSAALLAYFVADGWKHWGSEFRLGYWLSFAVSVVGLVWLNVRQYRARRQVQERVTRS